MQRNVTSTPKNQLETEVVLAQSHTAEFAHGLDSGIYEAQVTEFQAAGAPHIHFSDVQREMIKRARAHGRGLYDREGSWAFYYGVRAGIDSVVESFS